MSSETNVAPKVLSGTVLSWIGNLLLMKMTSNQAEVVHFCTYLIHFKNTSLNFDIFILIRTSLKYFCLLEVLKNESALTFTGRHMKHSPRNHSDAKKSKSISFSSDMRRKLFNQMKYFSLIFFCFCSSSIILVCPAGRSRPAQPM